MHTQEREMEKKIRIICFKYVISHAYVHMGEKSREDNTKNILFMNKKNGYYHELLSFDISFRIRTYYLPIQFELTFYISKVNDFLLNNSDFAKN